MCPPLINRWGRRLCIVPSHQSLASRKKKHCTGHASFLKKILRNSEQHDFGLKNVKKKHDVWAEKWDLGPSHHQYYKIKYIPGNSKWPFDPLFGGHFTIPKRSPAELPGNCILVSVESVPTQKSPNNPACWFQPIWKILVKLEIFPNFRGENKKCLKPPPRIYLGALETLSHDLADRPTVTYSTAFLIFFSSHIYISCVETML